MTIPSSININPTPREPVRARSVRERVDLLLELPVHRRHGGAPDAGPVQVLERREERDDARLLVRLRAARREARAHGRVVDDVARRDVRVQFLIET